MKKLKRALSIVLVITLIVSGITVFSPIQKIEAACSHIGQSTITKATCISLKKIVTKCKKCGEPLNTKTEGVLADHNYSEATCTKAKTCGTCGITEGTPQHSMKAPTCTTPWKCSICGVESGTANGHTYNKATCTEPMTCKICKDTTGTELGHSFSAATCISAKRCTRCGIGSGSPLNHRYVAATCTQPESCIRCNVARGKPLGHDMKDATCTTSQKCARCKVTGRPSLGHKPSTGYITIIESTCCSPGTEARTCITCREPIEKRDLPLTPHNFVVTTNEKAGCVTYGKIVETCNAVGCKGCRATRTQTIKPIGHNVEFNPQTCWQPTCVDYGYMEGRCKNCNEMVSYTPAPTGHKAPASFTRVSIEPTCEEPGEKVKECTKCGDVLETAAVEPLGHDINTVPDRIWNPDFGNTGQGIFYCTRGCTTETRVMELRRVRARQNIETEMVEKALRAMQSFYSSPVVRNSRTSKIQMEQIKEILMVLANDLDPNNTSLESVYGNNVLRINSYELKGNEFDSEEIQNIVDQLGWFIKILEELNLVTNEMSAPTLLFIEIWMETLETVTYMLDKWMYVSQEGMWYDANNNVIPQETLRKYVREIILEYSMDKLEVWGELGVEVVLSVVDEWLNAPALADCKTVEEIHQKLTILGFEDAVSAETGSFFASFDGECSADNIMADQVGDRCVQIIIYRGCDEFSRFLESTLPYSLFRVYFDKDGNIKRIFWYENFLQ